MEYIIKPNTNGNYTPPIPISDVTNLQTELNSIPTLPITISDVTNLQTELNSIPTLPITISDVTNLQTTLDEKYPETHELHDGLGGALANIVLTSTSTRYHAIRNFTGIAKVLMPAGVTDGKKFEIAGIDGITASGFIEVKDSTDTYVLAMLHEYESVIFTASSFNTLGWAIRSITHVLGSTTVNNIVTDNATTFDFKWTNRPVTFTGTDNQLARVPDHYTFGHLVEETFPFIAKNNSSGVITVKSLDEAITYGVANPGESLKIYPIFGDYYTFVDAKTLQAANTYADSLVLAGASSTDTLTNKRITSRVGSTTSSATPTINTDNFDVYQLTAQTADITSFTTNLSGTPTEAQQLIIEITGTAARAITWGTSFESSTITLPATTVSTNKITVQMLYNSVTSKWRCIWVA